MHPILNIALKGARKAGDLIIRGFERLDKITVNEKRKHDYVTEIDEQAEREIITIIQRNYPSHGILAEESGQTQGDDYVWIIDPLDGTTNFIHGFPHFAVSIGVKYKNVLEHGLIYDPFKQEIFTASRGQGAHLNDRRIRVSNCQSFDNALLATGIPHREIDHLDTYITMLYNIAKVAGDPRRAGSAALDLAYVAASRLDGYWEFGLGPWDIAAGSLIVKEAGGLVSDLLGGEDYLDQGQVLAATPKLFKKILQIVKPAFEQISPQALSK